MSRYGDAAGLEFPKIESCSVKIDEIPEVVASLRKNFDNDKTRDMAWRRQQLQACQRCLKEMEDEMCAAVKADVGKNESETVLMELTPILMELDGILENLSEWVQPVYTKTSIFNWPASSRTVSEPLGVVLIMGAWNYPMMLLLHPLISAIAAGNAVMLRPPDFAIESSHVLCRAINKYFDRDCVRVCEGGVDVTTALLKQKWDKICFTGSSFVGKIVAEAAAPNLTPVLLELGGKSPAIVDESAHLSLTAERVAWAAFVNCGQTCVRPDFVLVHEKVHNEFMALLQKYVKKHFGPNMQQSASYGRLVNKKGFDRIQGLLATGRSNLVFGGSSDKDQRYVEPTIFDFGSDLAEFQAHPLMQDEIFGPLLAVAQFSKFEDVIQFVRCLPSGKPLACYVYTKTSTVITEVETRISAGGMMVNDCMLHLANDELPFGGVGNSGMGAYHGRKGFTAFSHEKAVVEKYARVETLPLFSSVLAVRYPPYTKGKNATIALMRKRFVTNMVNILHGYSPRQLPRFILESFLFALFLRLLGIRVTISMKA